MPTAANRLSYSLTLVAYTSEALKSLIPGLILGSLARAGFTKSRTL